jgi:hypothetical protein
MLLTRRCYRSIPVHFATHCDIVYYGDICIRKGKIKSIKQCEVPLEYQYRELRTCEDYPSYSELVSLHFKEEDIISVSDVELDKCKTKDDYKIEFVMTVPYKSILGKDRETYFNIPIVNTDILTEACIGTSFFNNGYTCSVNEEELSKCFGCGISEFKDTYHDIINRVLSSSNCDKTIELMKYTRDDYVRGGISYTSNIPRIPDEEYHHKIILRRKMKKELKKEYMKRDKYHTYHRKHGRMTKSCVVNSYVSNDDDSSE